MDPISIARSGLAANMQRMTASASTIARAGASNGGPSQTDVTGALVDQLDAKIGAEANLKVIATTSDLERRTIELWG